MKKFVQRSYYGGLRESVLEQLDPKDRKNYQEGASMLKALGDPQRAMLIDALSCRPLCVYEMQQLVSWSQATLSHHLKTLRENGLVNTKREGKWIYYSLNPATLDLLSGVLGSLQRDADKKTRTGRCSPIALL